MVITSTYACVVNAHSNRCAICSGLNGAGFDLNLCLENSIHLYSIATYVFQPFTVTREFRLWTIYGDTDNARWDKSRYSQLRLCLHWYYEITIEGLWKVTSTCIYTRNKTNIISIYMEIMLEYNVCVVNGRCGDFHCLVLFMSGNFHLSESNTHYTEEVLSAT